MSEKSQVPARVKPIDDVRSNLQKMEGQFKIVLPPHISVEKFVRIVMTAIQQTPKLLECSRASLFAACMRAATDGLLPDGKEGAIVPYRSKSGMIAQWMPMVAGILKKVRNSGELTSIHPHLVHEKDEFKFWIDEDGEHLKHVPQFGDNRGEITHVYVIAKTKDGGTYIEVMSRDEVEKTRESSRAKDSGPWVSWFGEMAKKTGIRRLAKRLPMSTDLESVIRADDELYDVTGKDKAEIAAPSKTKSSRLSKIVETQETKELPAPTEEADPSEVETEVETTEAEFE